MKLNRNKGSKPKDQPGQNLAQPDPDKPSVHDRLAALEADVRAIKAAIGV